MQHLERRTYASTRDGATIISRRREGILPSFSKSDRAGDDLSDAADPSRCGIDKRVIGAIIIGDDGGACAKRFRRWKAFCRRRFVSLSVHFAELLARKGRNRKTWARGASDISMQKHLAASILAAYFPAAFEPSPLVSNVSSFPLPRFRRVLSFSRSK